MLTRDEPEDDGFTLVELLLSISILGVLMAVLVGVMFTSLTANKRTQELLGATRSEQLTAVHFGADAQGATQIVTQAAARCGTGSAVVEFRGVSFDPTTFAENVTVVTYVFDSSAGQLERRSCEASSSPGPSYPLTPSRTQIVGRDLASTAPTLACQPDPACPATSRTVTLTVTRSAGDVPFTLVGTRRAT